MADAHLVLCRFRCATGLVLLSSLAALADDAVTPTLRAKPHHGVRQVAHFEPEATETAVESEPTAAELPSAESILSDEPVLESFDSNAVAVECSEIGFCNECKLRPYFENISIFGGLDGSKQPQDFGVNALLGGRAYVNWGMPLCTAWGLGLQLGTSINASKDAVQVFERVEGTSGRVQNFSTVGIFQRLQCGLKWGVGYDLLAQDYYDNFLLGQWRLRVGYDFTQRDDVGVWCAIRGFEDDGTFDAIAVELDPLTQGAVYWRHVWKTCVQTTAWLGVAESHAEANLALGDLEDTGACFLYGASIHAPLNDRIAIWGETNLITPADTGTVDAYLGLVFYFAKPAAVAPDRPFAPLLPVANNTSFAVDLAR